METFPNQEKEKPEYVTLDIRRELCKWAEEAEKLQAVTHSPYGLFRDICFAKIQPLAKDSWSSKKERREDALALRAEERRDKLRKAAVRSKYPI